MTLSPTYFRLHLRRPIFGVFTCVFLLALLVAGAAPLAASDNLYAVIFDTLTDTEKLVIVDSATGFLTDVGTGIAGCCLISSGVSSIDAAGDVFYFVGRFQADPSDDQRIFALDLTTGTVLSNPLLPADTNYNFLEFDPGSDNLYAVVFDVPTDTEKLVIVDPATGSLTDVGTGIANCCLIPSGVSALDPDAGVFYFVGRFQAESSDVRHIFGLDLGTGALLSNPLLPTDTNYNFIEHDPSPGTLYGVVFDLLASQEKLVEIDPATGALTPVGAGIPNCCGISSGVSALDPNNDVFYFIGALMTESDRRVFSVGLGTGAVLANPLLPTTNNYNFLEFDPTPLNQPPVAVCQDVTVNAGPMCTADADVDGGSFDPDGDPITLAQDPPGPYGPGETSVTLTVEDDEGATDTCGATVTVVDATPPLIECNAPATITPPDASISFTATAVDACGDTTGEVTGFDCFKLTKKGKRVDKTGSCIVEVEGTTVTVLDSGGVGDHITWEVTATDGAGNEATETCEVEVVNPGKS